jgi:hypothetical protein
MSASVILIIVQDTDLHSCGQTGAQFTVHDICGGMDYYRGDARIRRISAKQSGAILANDTSAESGHLRLRNATQQTFSLLKLVTILSVLMSASTFHLIAFVFRHWR